MKRLVLTCGDVNGIGPEISVKLLYKISQKPQRQIIFCCPYNVFLETCNSLKIRLEHVSIKKIESIEQIQNQLIIFDTGNVKVSFGKISKVAGRIAFMALEHAIKIIDAGYTDTIVTAPISKESIHLTGFNFPGHTEYLAHKADCKKFMMMFISSKLKCALATVHIPIKEVSKKLNKNLLKNHLNLLHTSLQKDFGIHNPKIAVLGLNPHAGENSTIGKEETLIKQAIDESNSDSLGPFVPDAFFGNHLYKNYNMTLGMYHDQILIPFKMLDFAKGVNFTAGLPFVRTSPDHGTGFDIAGQNKANFSSIESAYNWAIKISNIRYRNEKSL
jgi:4-hydroxythreonine-4-phosphate dehydrogenase